MLAVSDPDGLTPAERKALNDKLIEALREADEEQREAAKRANGQA
jgi:hypothetical protein